MYSIEELQEEIRFLESEKHRLSEIIGVWRRKAQDKAPRMNPEILSESYSERDRMHYVTYRAPDIPADLPFKEALHEVKEVFIPKVAPYKFSRLFISKKYESWAVTTEAPIKVNMTTQSYDSDTSENL